MSDELPPQPRATPAPSQLPAPVNQANLVQACSPIASMTHEQKMAEAIKRANLPPAIMAQLGDPKTLIASAVIAGGVLAGLAATGYGAVAEAIGAGLLVLGAAMSGVQIGQGIGALVDFFEMTRCDQAQSPDDLDKAGKRFADGVAAMGVGGLTLALSLLGARGKSGKFDNRKGTLDSDAAVAKLPSTQDPTLRQELGADWFKENGKLRWPDGKEPGTIEDGFDAPPYRDVLQSGTKLDRYGSESGKFLSPAGTAYEARALPYDPLKVPYKKYQVIKPLPVQAGRAKPWFGQQGQGVQYKTDMSVDDLLAEGYLAWITE